MRKRWPVTIALVLLAVAVAAPFFYMISVSFMGETELLRWPPALLPHAPTTANYVAAFGAVPWSRRCAGTPPRHARDPRDSARDPTIRADDCPGLGRYLSGIDLDGAGVGRGHSPDAPGIPDDAAGGRGSRAARWRRGMDAVLACHAPARAAGGPHGGGPRLPRPVAQLFVAARHHPVGRNAGC